VKEYIGYDLMKVREHAFAKEAMKRLSQHPNIVLLGNTQAERLPIFSFLVYTGSAPNLNGSFSDDDVMHEADSNKNKPLHCRFVAKLLSDLFGIQARGGCACAGPYGHYLLEVSKDLSLCIRSAIKQVCQNFCL
jgi:selenocysteine lyase/cysteine desulfurase